MKTIPEQFWAALLKTDGPRRIFELLSAAPNIAGPWELHDGGGGPSDWGRRGFTRDHGLDHGEAIWTAYVYETYEDEVADDCLAFETAPAGTLPAWHFSFVDYDLACLPDAGSGMATSYPTREAAQAAADAVLLAHGWVLVP